MFLAATGCTVVLSLTRNARMAYTCTNKTAVRERTPMHLFRNDYSEGACPEVLDALVRTNAEQCVGYTCD